MLPCLGGDDLDDLDLNAHKCHVLDDEEFQRISPCLESCIDESPTSAVLPPLRHERLLEIAKNIDACSAPGALTVSASPTATAGDEQRTNVTNTIARTLRRCGVVFLQDLVSGGTASAAHAELSALNSDELKGILVRTGAHFDRGGHATGPFEPKPNLRGGRYQVIPRATTGVMGVVSEVASGAVASALGEVWGGGTGPQLGYLTGMLQGVHGARSWTQGAHPDSESAEDAQLQVHLHDYDDRAGPLEVFLCSHVMAHALGRHELSAGLRLALLKDTFPAAKRSQAKAGDAVLYLSGLFHRGLGSSDQGEAGKRSSLVFMLQSSGRRRHASELLKMQAAVDEHAETAIFRALWLGGQAGANTSLAAAVHSTESRLVVAEAAARFAAVVRAEVTKVGSEVPRNLQLQLHAKTGGHLVQRDDPQKGVERFVEAVHVHASYAYVSPAYTQHADAKEGEL
jgi:hypothetical protein